MKPCPQCGTELGEGAKACASCGWKKGMSKVLLVFLIVFGVLLLVCGGCTVWVGLQAKKAWTLFQDEATPMMLATYHLAVVRYAEENDALPESLQEAVQATGERVTMPPGKEGQAQGTVDSWLRPVRYAKNEDGTFEIRSGGPDGQMDTPDDIVEKGSKGEDLKELRAEASRRKQEWTRRMTEAFGGKVNFDTDGEEGK